MYRELTEKEKAILMNMAKEGEGDVAKLKENLSMSSQYVNVYRNRLIKKGILHSPSRGKLSFALPRFREYLEYQEEYEFD